MAKEVKKTQQSGFMRWYESYQGKRVVGVVYSVGAAVVIIGALFKIMHFPGAGAVLMVGMITEAILFLIGCLDKPHAEFHWQNVFPQLLEHGADPQLLEEMQSRPKPTLMGGGNTGVSSSNAESVSTLSVTDMAALKQGIENLTKTATQLNELSKVATASNQLATQLNSAEAAVGQFVNAGKEMAQNSANFGAVYAKVAENMQTVASDTQEYEAQLTAIAKQLTTLNSVYALQLNAVQNQTEKLQGVGKELESLQTSMATMNGAAAEALKAQEAYQAGAKQLAAQVADLNKVYGNMLNALS